jgi:hypothetical protein
MIQSLNTAQKRFRAFKHTAIAILVSSILLVIAFNTPLFVPVAKLQVGLLTAFSIGGLLLAAALYIVYYIFATSQHPASGQEQSPNAHNMLKQKLNYSNSVALEHFYSGGAISLKRIVDIMGNFSAQNNNTPLVLLLSSNGTLEFKAGWYCSPAVGLSLAAQIKASSMQHITHQCVLKVAEIFMPAFAVAFGTRIGIATLLILQPDANTLHDARNAFMLDTAAQIPSLLNAITQALEAQQCIADLSTKLPAPQKLRMITACCICNRIERGDSEWIPLAGLDAPPAVGTAFSHGICPGCLSRYYHSQ